MCVATGAFFFTGGFGEAVGVAAACVGAGGGASIEVGEAGEGGAAAGAGGGGGACATGGAVGAGGGAVGCTVGGGGIEGGAICADGEVGFVAGGGECGQKTIAASSATSETPPPMPSQSMFCFTQDGSTTGSADSVGPTEGCAHALNEPPEVAGTPVAGSPRPLTELGSRDLLTDPFRDVLPEPLEKGVGAGDSTCDGTERE